MAMATLPLKLAFLLAGGIRGSYTPYLNIFFESVGLTPSQAGLINGLRDIPATLALPLWGILTDHTGRRKLIFTVMCLGTMFSLVSMPVVSYILCPISDNEARHTNTSAVRNATLENNGGNTDVSQRCTSVLFYILLSLLFFVSVFAVPVVSYIDTIVINAVESINNSGAVDSNSSSDRKVTFGIQKLFFEIGFPLSTLFGGIAADHFKYAGWSEYTAVFLIPLPCALFLIPTACFVISKINWNNGEEDIAEENGELTTTANTKLKRLCLMFRNFDIVFFMATVLICGVAQAVHVNFTFLLVKDEATSSKTKMSLVLVTSALSAMFGFLISSTIIAFLRGPIFTITLGTFSYFIRFLVLSYTRNIWIMIAIQTLNFLSFSVCRVAMTEYTQRVTPKEINATMHSITQGVYFGLGGMIANIPGGKLYEVFGGRMVFRGVGIICLAWSLLMLVIHMRKHVCPREGQYTGKQHATEMSLLNDGYRRLPDDATNCNQVN